jgi:hypothetical protein
MAVNKRYDVYLYRNIGVVEGITYKSLVDLEKAYPFYPDNPDVQYPNPMLFTEQLLADDIYTLNNITLSLAKFPDWQTGNFPNLDTDIIIVKSSTGEHAGYYCVAQQYNYNATVDFTVRLAVFLTISAQTVTTLNAQCLRRTQTSEWGINQLQESTLGLSPNRAMYKIDIDCDIDIIWSTLDLSQTITSSNQPLSPSTAITLADGRTTNIPNLGAYRNVPQSTLDNLMSLGLWDSLISNGFIQPVKIPSSICTVTGDLFISEIDCGSVTVSASNMVYGAGSETITPNLTPYVRGQSVRLHCISLSSGDSIARDVYQVGGGMDDNVEMILTCIPFANAGLYCGFKNDKLTFNDLHEYGTATSGGLPSNMIITKQAPQSAYRAALFLQQQLQIDNNAQVANTQFQASMGASALNQGGTIIQGITAIGGSILNRDIIGTAANAASGLINFYQNDNAQKLTEAMYGLNATARDIQTQSAAIAYQASQAVSPSVIALPAASAAAFERVSFLVIKEAPSDREVTSIQNFVNHRGELTYDYMEGEDFADWLNGLTGLGFIQLATVTSLVVDSADIDTNVPVTYFIKQKIIQALLQGVTFLYV